MALRSWNFSPVRSLLAVCALGVLLGSCGSATKSLDLAEQNVQVFHAQLDTEQYDAVYSASDEKLQQSTPEADFVKFLGAVHRKLGNVEEATLQHTGVAWYSGQGATVTLVYQTQFAQGSGTEQFVWHVKDNGAVLYGYHINSNELITK
jgi:hypothetical protein